MPSNIIPKENIPKTAEVREIESKITTYEEFVKNYQADRGVNDSYRSEIEGYKDIGVSKSFGPCSWSNTRCDCYVSQGFVPLNMSCPSCIANTNTPYIWTHSGGRLATSNRSSSCEGQLFVSKNAHIKCIDCGEEGSWREWVFKCSNHYGYEHITSNRTFMTALNLVGGLFSNDARTQEIIRELVANLLASW